MKESPEKPTSTANFYISTLPTKVTITNYVVLCDSKLCDDCRCVIGAMEVESPMNADFQNDVCPVRQRYDQVPAASTEKTAQHQ